MFEHVLDEFEEAITSVAAPDESMHVELYFSFQQLKIFQPKSYNWKNILILFHVMLQKYTVFSILIRCKTKLISTHVHIMIKSNQQVIPHSDSNLILVRLCWLGLDAFMWSYCFQFCVKIQCLWDGMQLSSIVGLLPGVYCDVNVV